MTLLYRLCGGITEASETAPDGVLVIEPGTEKHGLALGRRGRGIGEISSGKLGVLFLFIDMHTGHELLVDIRPKITVFSTSQADRRRPHEVPAVHVGIGYSITINGL